MNLLSLVPAEVKCVLFDADGTIFSLARPISEEYRDVCEKLGVIFPVKSIDKIVSKTWVSMSKEYLNEINDYKTTYEREKNFWHSFAREVVTEASGLVPNEEVIKALYERYSSPNTRIVNEGVYETLSALKEKGIILGILTNNDERTKKIVSKLPLSSLIDHVFAAGDLGWKKPSPKCFKEAENILGFKPSELMYVGDSLEIDINPAKECGWHTAWFKNDAAIF